MRRQPNPNPLGLPKKNDIYELDNAVNIEAEAVLHITHATRIYIVFVNNSNPGDVIIIKKEMENAFHSHMEKLTSFFDKFYLPTVIRKDIVPNRDEELQE